MEDLIGRGFIVKYTHPNLLLIDSTDKKFIEVSKIREILNFSTKTSFSNKKKIVLINNVEKMKSAQNDDRTRAFKMASKAKIRSIWAQNNCFTKNVFHCLH